MAKKPYNGGSSSLADFKQLCLLGEGAYSAVYKVLRLADREIYALKKVKLPSLSDKEKQNALNEVRLLASVHHENIIAYKEAFFDDKTRCLCVVMEFSDSGDLFQQITKCQKERTHPKEGDVWRYLYGMCHGLKALHDMRILHRDLKCANVFLSSSESGTIAKLGDFNVSKVAKRGLCMTQTGTPYYASPEVWRDMPYDAKSDMWSLGCVLYEMVALRPPFRAEDMEGLYRKVLRGQYPRIPQHFSNDLSEVIGVLLQVNPRHRPSIEQLLQMPVMQRHSTNNEPEHRPADLLSTIKLPKNAIDLSGCLPGPQYDMEMGLRHYMAPPSQESAGDIAAGTGKMPQQMRQGRGQQMTPQSQKSHNDGASRLGDNNHDSLDAYLAGNQAPSVLGPDRGYPAPAQQRAAPPMPALPQGYQGHQSQVVSMPPIHQQPASGHLPQLGNASDKQGDSLDAYVQRQRHGRQQRLPPSEYGDHGAEESRLPRHAASPAPSSQARGPPVYTRQPAYAEQPAYGVQQYRHPERRNYQQERRQMANYARPQYALGAGGSAVSQASPPRQQTGERRQSGGGGLRLPRIFTKG